TLREPPEPARVPAVEQDAVGVELRGTRGVPARPETADERLDGGRARVRPQAQETAFAEGLRGDLRLVVAEDAAELTHRPRGHPGADEDVLVRRTPGRCGRIISDLSQDRV